MPSIPSPDWADLVHPGCWHRLPPPCSMHMPSIPSPDWADLVHPASPHAARHAFPLRTTTRLPLRYLVFFSARFGSDGATGSVSRFSRLADGTSAGASRLRTGLSTAADGSSSSHSMAIRGSFLERTQEQVPKACKMGRHGIARLVFGLFEIPRFFPSPQVWHPDARIKQSDKSHQTLGRYSQSISSQMHFHI